MLGDSYVSLGVAMLLFLVAYKLAPSKVSCKNRIMIGVLHASVHLAAALIIMLTVEFSIETTVKTEGQFSLSLCLTLIPRIFSCFKLFGSVR